MVRTLVKDTDAHVVASQISADNAAAAAWVVANDGDFPVGYTTSDDSTGLSTASLIAQGLVAQQEGAKCMAKVWQINVAKNQELADNQACLADADVILMMDALKAGFLKEAQDIISNSVTAVFTGGEKTAIADAIQTSIDAVGY